MKVAWFPKMQELKANPYWEFLQLELEKLGVIFEDSHNGSWLSYRWLWNHSKKVNVLHFHFIQPQYGSPDRRVSAWRLCKFVQYLISARVLGYHIIWTMHDLFPPYPMTPSWLETIAHYFIAHFSHDIIVHCQEAKRLLKQHFHRTRRVWVLPLPSYRAIYSHSMSMSSARQFLALENESFVFAFVGGIRPNKGIEDVINSFHKIKNSKTVLIIAGRPMPPEDYIEYLQSLSSPDPRIHLCVHEIPPDQLPYYLIAADILVFPFKNILTSSSVILAMSFGRPVIVPRLGCLPELVQQDAGIVYEPCDEEGLFQALNQAFELDLGVMGKNAFDRVNEFDWDDLARETLKVYTQC